MWPFGGKHIPCWFWKYVLQTWIKIMQSWTKVMQTWITGHLSYLIINWTRGSKPKSLEMKKNGGRNLHIFKEYWHIKHQCKSKVVPMGCFRIYITSNNSNCIVMFDPPIHWLEFWWLVLIATEMKRYFQRLASVATIEGERWNYPFMAMFEKLQYINL